MSEKAESPPKNTTSQDNAKEMAKAGFDIGVEAVKTAAVWILAGFMTKSVKNLINKSVPDKEIRGRESSSQSSNEKS